METIKYILWLLFIYTVDIVIKISITNEIISTIIILCVTSLFSYKFVKRFFFLIRSNQ